MIKVLLADDHTIIREGLKVYLEMQSEIQVVGEATNGSEAVEKACQLEPDVVVMDISMPELNGIEATKKIIQNCPQTRVIILSMLGTPEHVFKALQAGALGYLLKESASRDVVDAVFSVYAGKRYLSEPITNILVSDYLLIHGSENVQDPLESLSQREREILLLVVEGKSSAEIGKMLYLSPKTVETYRSRMMKKLGVSDLAGLVKYALQHGLID